MRKQFGKFRQNKAKRRKKKDGIHGNNGTLNRVRIVKSKEKSESKQVRHTKLNNFNGFAFGVIF